MQKFVSINSSELKRQRYARGWTQQDLANRAGYSVRLVRKAEIGGRLELQTVNDLADALSEFGPPVPIHALCADRLSMARTFVESYDNLGTDMMSGIESILTDDFVFEVPGDPSSAPFVGSWHGKQGMARFVEIFFSIVSRQKGSLTPTYTSNEQCVSAHYVDTMMVPGNPPTVLWVNLHFYFANGLIQRVIDQYDTLAASKTVVVQNPLP